MEGWIKIERAILDHWIFQDAEYFRAWMYILLTVNHEDRTILVNHTPTKIKRGTMLTSIAKLAEKLGWSRSKTHRYIKLLISEKMITKSGTPSGTLLTVVKYGFYQGQWNTHDTPGDTPDDTPGDTQTRMYKNVKKERTRASARSSPPTLAEKMEAIRRRAQEEEAKNEQQ